MERRDFIRNSALGAVGLVGLINLPLGAEDSATRIREEIAELMERTNTIIEYSYSEGVVRHTNYISPSGIWKADIPLPKLNEIKERLEENLRCVGESGNIRCSIYVNRDEPYLKKS